MAIGNIITDHPSLNPVVPTVTRKVPLVSIGIPVYNGAKFIREALNSLLGQTFTDFELIISDNASTDETEAICREYAAKDVRIRYVRQVENLGPMANFKYVLDESVGVYFMWAAADDRRNKQAIEMMVNVFNDDKDVGLVFSDMSTKNLLTGEIIHSSVGYINPGAKKYKKYLFRLTNGCPSLIYGLHKRGLLKKFEIRSYDWLDIHLTHWYELNSSIKVIPLNLYIAGTNDIRIPYSLTHQKLNATIFLKNEWKILRQHFNFFAAAILYAVTFFLYKKNMLRLNKLILKK